MNACPVKGGWRQGVSFGCSVKGINLTARKYVTVTIIQEQVFFVCMSVCCVCGCFICALVMQELWGSLDHSQWSFAPVTLGQYHFFFFFSLLPLLFSVLFFLFFHTQRGKSMNHINRVIQQREREEEEEERERDEKERVKEKKGGKLDKNREDMVWCTNDIEWWRQNFRRHWQVYVKNISCIFDMCMETSSICEEETLCKCKSLTRSLTHSLLLLLLSLSFSLYHHYHQARLSHARYHQKSKERMQLMQWMYWMCISWFIFNRNGSSVPSTTEKK